MIETKDNYFYYLRSNNTKIKIINKRYIITSEMCLYNNVNEIMS